MRRSFDICLKVMVSLVLIIIQAYHAYPQETSKWTGKLNDGRTITSEDLAKIIHQHEKWLFTKGREGKRAELMGAILTGANLNRADLSQSILMGAKLDSAQLYMTKLNRAILSGVTLNGASIAYAELNGANLGGAKLKGALIHDSQLNSTTLVEPKLAAKPKDFFHNVESFLRNPALVLSLVIIRMILTRSEKRDFR